MCEIDWIFTAEMLTGIGTIMTGIAAMIVLPVQLGYRREARELRKSMHLMRIIYRQYMASAEGIVWKDYPSDADQVIDGIARKTGLDKVTIRELLDDLNKDGRL